MDVPESFQPTASRREIRVPSESEYSLKIAQRYLDGELTYGTCDAIMNDLWGAVTNGVVASKDFSVPAPFYEIFLAFDAGEYYRTKEKTDDPVSDFTNPVLIEILSKFTDCPDQQ
jgi:hypothetical protein